LEYQVLDVAFMACEMPNMNDFIPKPLRSEERAGL
jgi:hypothetical protein